MCLMCVLYRNLGVEFKKNSDVKFKPSMEFLDALAQAYYPQGPVGDQREGMTIIALMGSTTRFGHYMSFRCLF